jgi:beta-barrel assembly-enhancing protease
MAFDAVLFDPTTGDSSRVAVQIVRAWLEIVREGHDTVRVDSTKCEVKAGGWDNQSVQVTWNAEGKSWALSATAADVGDELGKIPRFQDALTKADGVRRRTVRAGRIGRTLVVLLILLPLLAAGLVYVSRDAIVDAVVRKIPMSVDTEIGRLFDEEMLKANDLPRDSEAAVAVAAIVRRLQAAQAGGPFACAVRVQKDPQVNAYALPGCRIVVYTGLLTKAESAEEAAGVLAHEIAHATRRHSLRQLIYAAGVLPLVDFMIGEPDAVTVVRELGSLSRLRFTREQEEDADLVAFETVVAAKLSPQAMAALFDRLGQDEEPNRSFLSTHPASAERAEAIRKRAEGGSASSPEPLNIDWKRVRDSLGAIGTARAK